MNRMQLVEAAVFETNITRIEIREAVDAAIRVTAQLRQEDEKPARSGSGVYVILQPARTGPDLTFSSRQVSRFRSSVVID